MTRSFLKPSVHRSVQPSARQPDRRTLLRWFGVSSLAMLAPNAFADTLKRTPRQAKGPFYPDRMPLDRDNDLIIINDNLTPAIGQLLHLSGQVRDRSGQAVRSALVEIWQCDANGYYIHTDDFRTGKADSNFQGYGRFETDSTGSYRFRTIRPVPYETRPPHIHVQVTAKGHKRLVTQMYAARDPDNPRDPVIRAARRSRKRSRLTLTLESVENSPIGELHSTFDLVL